jgi:hypothetical protein
MSTVRAFDNPIARRILKSLRAGRTKHAVRWGLLVSLAAAIVLIGLPMSLLPPGYLIAANRWGFLMAAGQMSLIVWGELLKQAVGIGGALLAIVVARRMFRDRGSDLLALTPYSSRQVRLAMLGAVLRYLLVPLLLATLIRALLVAVISQPQLTGSNLLVPTALLRFNALSVPFFIQRTVGGMSVAGYTFWELWTRQLAMIAYLRIWPLWIGYYVVQPVWDALLLGLVALLAESKTRRGDEGLLGAAGVVVGLWGAGYLGERLLSALLIWLWDSWVYVHWFPGIPAMGSGFIGVNGLFSLTLGTIAGVKLLILSLLLADLNRSSAGRSGGP